MHFFFSAFLVLGFALPPNASASRGLCKVLLSASKKLNQTQQVALHAPWLFRAAKAHSHVVFSRSGDTFILPSTLDRKILLGDPANGTIREQVSFSAEIANLALYEPQNYRRSGSSFLAVADTTGSVRFLPFSPFSGTEVGTLGRDVLGEGNKSHLLFTRDRMFTASDNAAGIAVSSIVDGDPMAGETLFKIATDHPIYSMAISPSGKTLAFNSDNWIYLVDLPRLELRAKTRKPDNRVFGIEALRGVPDAVLRHELPEPEAAKMDQERFLTEWSKGEVDAFSLTSKPMRSYFMLSFASEDKLVAVSPSRAMFATSVQEPKVLWIKQAENPAPQSQADLLANEGIYYAFALAEDGETFVTASNDETLSLWNTYDGSLVTKFGESRGELPTNEELGSRLENVSHGHLSFVGGKVVLIDERPSLRIWEIEDEGASELLNIDARLAALQIQFDAKAARKQTAAAQGRNAKGQRNKPPGKPKKK